MLHTSSTAGRARMSRIGYFSAGEGRWHHQDGERHSRTNTSVAHQRHEWCVRPSDQQQDARMIRKLQRMAPGGPLADEHIECGATAEHGEQRSAINGQ